VAPWCGNLVEGLRYGQLNEPACFLMVMLLQLPILLHCVELQQNMLAGGVPMSWRDTPFVSVKLVTL